MFLKILEAILKMGKRRKIVGGEHFSSVDGEIDLNLIDPAGMNRVCTKRALGQRVRTTPSGKEPGAPDLKGCSLKDFSWLAARDGWGSI